MRISQTMVVFDASELEPESAFWAGLYGGTVDKEDDWHTVRVDGKPVVGVQLAPGHVPPQWPDGPPQQVHLDVFVEDIAAAHEEAVQLGARVLQDADKASQSGFVVYADPGGHPFCLCW